MEYYGITSSFTLKKIIKIKKKIEKIKLKIQICTFSWQNIGNFIIIIFIKRKLKRRERAYIFGRIQNKYEINKQ